VCHTGGGELGTRHCWEREGAWWGLGRASIGFLSMPGWALQVPPPARSEKKVFVGSRYVGADGCLCGEGRRDVLDGRVGACAAISGEGLRQVGGRHRICGTVLLYFFVLLMSPGSWDFIELWVCGGVGDDVGGATYGFFTCALR